MGSSWFSFLFTTWGVCLLGALDSTLIFFLPVAVDLGVVVLSSRTPRFFWLFPILVSASSLVGAAVTFYIGKRIGEAGISSFVSERKVKRAKGAMKTSGAIAMAALDLIPPPFPFTALILAAGALDVSVPRFFTALFAVRILRFGAEATLAAIYG